MTRRTSHHTSIARYGACLALTIGASFSAAGVASAHHTPPHALEQDAQELQEDARSTAGQAFDTAGRAGHRTRSVARERVAATRRDARRRTRNASRSALRTPRCAVAARTGDTRRAATRARRCLPARCRIVRTRDRLTSRTRTSVRRCIRRGTKPAIVVRRRLIVSFAVR